MKQKVLYLLTLLALVLSACTGGAANQPAIARVGWAGSPDTLNPGMAILTEAYTMFELVYDRISLLERVLHHLF